MLQLVCFLLLACSTLAQEDKIKDKDDRTTTELNFYFAKWFYVKETGFNFDNVSLAGPYFTETYAPLFTDDVSFSVIASDGSTTVNIVGVNNLMAVFTNRANRVRHQISMFNIEEVNFDTLDVVVMAFENSVVQAANGTRYGSLSYDKLDCRLVKTFPPPNSVYGWQISDISVREFTTFYELLPTPV